MTSDEGGRDRSFFRPSPAKEVDDELAFHLAMRARDLAALGRTDGERIAEQEFGDLARVKAECRDIAKRRDGAQRRTRFFSELSGDVRFAIRRLVRRPAFAALTVGTVALGIGAATGIFSVVDGVLLKSLPFPDPGSLVAVWMTEPSLAKDPILSKYANGSVVGTGEYAALRDQATTLRSVAAWTQATGMLETSSGNEEVDIAVTTASMLPVLGLTPVKGRGFLPEENVLNGRKVALVSWETWQSRFGGDPSILSKRVTLDEDSYDIVGVLPVDLRLERAKPRAAFWIPAMQAAYDDPAKRNRSYRVLARLKPGVTETTAQAEVARIYRAAASDTLLSARVENWQRDQTREVRTPLLIILAASGLLLLIGCVNVAMLMLGDAASREREMAARVALGASRLRVVRQLLVESLTIALSGAVGGTVIAWALERSLIALAPAQLPGIESAELNWPVLAFAVACAMTAGVLFGLAPAVSQWRGGGTSSIRAGSGQTAGRAAGTQRLLIAVEVALSVVLLVGAALLSRSLRELSGTDPGFRASQVSVVRLTAPAVYYRDKAMRLLFAEEGVRRVRALPGVLDVSAGSNVPYAGGSSSSPVTVDGRTYPKGRPPFTEQRSVLPGYFELLHIPVVAGRTFSAADVEGAEFVAVVGAAAAKRDFPGESAIGKLVRYQGKLRRIVGVVGDVRAARLGKDAGPAIYVPLPQHNEGNVSFIIRSTTDARVLASAVREQLREVNPIVVVRSVDPLSTLVARSYADERYRTVIVLVFAVLAALLAVVGLYGVTVRAVARRQREVGIRVALGATSASVTWLMMRDTAVGVGAGVVVGLPLALFAGRSLAPYLFKVAPSDPVVYASVLGMLGAVALLSSGLPARRAARMNPAVVLSAE